MKKCYGVCLILCLCFASKAHADFVSGSTGADGPFYPTLDTVLQLPPDGVFHFTTVDIPEGVTVTFTKNAGNTPVYILASGSVTIAGEIDVDGQSMVYSNPVLPMHGSGGPGGYDGGSGGASATEGGKGLGPGGGGGGPTTTYRYGGGGGHASPGGSQGANYGAGGPAYGNARLFPLMGGSGGGGMAGSTTAYGYGGGGGGGAVLIASSASITVSGSITADGGNGYNYSGGGSGGSIRLIANTISGTGLMSAKGGSLSGNLKGGPGRIRIEAFTNTYTSGTDPQYTYGQPGPVFPANVPSLAITSIAGANVPANPGGSYAQPDILLPDTTTNPVTVNISASNIPTGTTVAVTVTPQFGGSTSVDATLSGTYESSTASAAVTLSTEYANVITAQAVFTLLASFYYENETIDRVRVAAKMGGESEAVYITESGRELPAAEVLARLRKAEE